MKIKKYRNDHFFTIRLSLIELFRLSKLIDEGLLNLTCRGKDLPIDVNLKLEFDQFFE